MRTEVDCRGLKGTQLAKLAARSALFDKRERSTAISRGLPSVLDKLAARSALFDKRGK